MASKTVNFSVRMDTEVKKQCEEIYGQLGVNLTTAINVFLRQSIRSKGFPFEVRLYSPTPEIVEDKPAPSLSENYPNLV